jgi:hypothetical protein
VLGLFIALGRRRRSDDPTLMPVATEAAGAGAAVATFGSLTTFAESRGIGTPVVTPDTPPEEAGIPRWRRPSVRAARQVSERGVVLPHVPLRFIGQAGVEVTSDRRVVRYRLVRVSSVPDELAGEEVGRLDRGDEVEILREESGYFLVRAPDGTEGWIHRTTVATPQTDELEDKTA